VKTQKNTAEDAGFVYQCRLPLSGRTVNLVRELLAAHLKKICSRWRKLPTGQIALIVLAHLRHDQRLADLAGGNAVSPSTIRRWVKETIKLLAGRAPRLDRALAKIKKGGGEVVLLDGSLVRTQRRSGKDNRRNYSGKHKTHGLLFLGITDTHGNLLWISAAQPGRSSEITTARRNKITRKLREHDLGSLADLGFVGLDTSDDPVVITGRKRKKNTPLTPAEQQVNQLIARERAPVEHGFATWKNWRILTRLRSDPAHATTLGRALLVLAATETTR
jgi:hypothetical protein